MGEEPFLPPGRPEAGAREIYHRDEVAERPQHIPRVLRDAVVDEPLLIRGLVVGRRLHEACASMIVHDFGKQSEEIKYMGDPVTKTYLIHYLMLRSPFISQDMPLFCIAHARL
jgi:hypothetical protein